jgi:hypothetical protein
MRPPFPKWAQRSADYGNLFNPAFLMFVLGAACQGFEAEQKDVSEARELGMPFSLLFLVAPLALSPEFNEARPSRLAGSLVSWSKKHPAIAANMSAAAYSLVPAVREAIVYGLRAEHIQAGDEGRFREGAAHGALEFDARTALAGHLKNAAFAGRWLAKSGATTSILEAFGLRP